MYWGVTAMDLMGKLQVMDRNKIIQFLSECQHESGGFRPVQKHDPHLLSTLSAIQVAVTLDCLDHLDVESAANYVANLQKSGGFRPVQKHDPHLLS